LKIIKINKTKIKEIIDRLKKSEDWPRKSIDINLGDHDIIKKMKCERDEQRAELIALRENLSKWAETLEHPPHMEPSNIGRLLAMEVRKRFLGEANNDNQV
jgi:hypothetical protein